MLVETDGNIIHLGKYKITIDGEGELLSITQSIGKLLADNIKSIGFLNGISLEKIEKESLSRFG